MATSITFDILAKDRASHAFKDAGAAAEKSAERWRKFGSVVRSSGIAVAAGVTAVGLAGVKLAQGAADDQAAALRMAIAFKNNADATKGQIAQTEQWITAQGKAKGVADDDLRPALTRLIAVTHDVGKAQKLTSLAMDVSAGSGKSLDTVTSALTKAQLGSLGGLSRLGVATKDAKGKTLDLETVTKNLAKTYSGQATKAASTASGEFQRLKVAFSEAGENIGYKLLPAASSLADLLNNKAVPALNGMWNAFERNGLDGATHRLEAYTGTQGKLTPILHGVEDAAQNLADVFVNSVLPAFEDGAKNLPSFVQPLKLADQALGFLADHAEATKVAVEGLTLYLGYNRLATLAANAAFKLGVGSLGQYATAAERAEARSKAMGSALKTAAGLGGMLALSYGAEHADSKLSILADTAGGAALGSALGPEGALLGGAIGASVGLLKLAGRTDDAAAAMHQAIPDASDYAGTLSDVNASATAATRSQVLLQLTNTGALQASQRLGISTRDLIGSLTGQEGASKRVSAALTTMGHSLTYAGFAGQDIASSQKYKDYEQLTRSLQGVTAQYKSQTAAKKQEILVDQNFTALLHKIPKSIYTKIDQTGVTPTVAGIAKVISHYKVLDSRKNIKTVIGITGVDTTVREVQKVLAKLGDAKKVKPDLSPYTKGVQSSMDTATRLADLGSQLLLKNLLNPVKNAKGDLSLYSGSIVTGINHAKGVAGSGGRGVGAQLASGTASGIYSGHGIVNAAATSIIASAVAAMKARAKIKSPSQVMRDEVGAQLGTGIVIGLRSKKGDLTAAGAEMIEALAHGIGSKGSDIQRTLDAITAKVSSTAAKVKSLQGLKSSTVGDFQGFATSVFATAAPTNADGSEGPLTIDTLLSAQSAQRDQAVQVQAAVARLRRRGLSPAVLKQLQAAGSAGIPQILALSQGSAAQIALENSLNKQTQAAYGATGLGVFNQLHGTDLVQAKQNAATAKAVRDAVVEALHHHLKVEGTVKVHGSDIIIAIKKAQHERSKHP